MSTTDRGGPKGVPPPWPDGKTDVLPTGSPRGWKRARLATDGEVHVVALYSDAPEDVWSVTGEAFCHMGGDPFAPGHLEQCQCGLRVWDSRVAVDRDLSTGIVATINPIAVLCAVEWRPPSTQERRYRRVAAASLIGVSVRNYCLRCARRGVRGFIRGRQMGRTTYELWGVCERCADETLVTIDEAAASLGVPVVVDPWMR